MYVLTHAYVYVALCVLCHIALTCVCVCVQTGLMGRTGSSKEVILLLCTCLFMEHVHMCTYSAPVWACT